MLLPVTHFLYMAMALACVGVWLSLVPRDAEGRTLARVCLFSGTALAATAFARYWGSNDGQALALVALAMLALSALAPEREPSPGGEA